MKLSSATAYCLDLDGTIADTIPFLFEVYKTLLSEYDREGTKKEFNELMGPSLEEISVILCKRHGIEVSAEKVYARYMGLISDAYVTQVQMLDGAHRFIEWAVENGKRLALVTSNDTTLAEGFLEANGLMPHFSAVITAQRVNRRKPDPECYQNALAALDIASTEAVAVEDSPPGVEAAINAGIRTIWIGAEHHDPYSPDLVTARKDWHHIHTTLQEELSHE